jgi:hypothetical protein
MDRLQLVILRTGIIHRLKEVATGNKSFDSFDKLKAYTDVLREISKVDNYSVMINFQNTINVDGQYYNEPDIRILEGERQFLRLYQDARDKKIKFDFDLVDLATDEEIESLTNNYHSNLLFDGDPLKKNGEITIQARYNGEL